MWKCTNKLKRDVCAFGTKLHHGLVMNSFWIFKNFKTFPTCMVTYQRPNLDHIYSLHCYPKDSRHFRISTQSDSHLVVFEIHFYYTLPTCGNENMLEFWDILLTNYLCNEPSTLVTTCFYLEKHLTSFISKRILFFPS
jgi:hypothetical protein